MKRKVKIDSRGGRRTPKSNRTSQGLLIEEIIRQNGGYAKVAEMFGVGRQVPFNWVRRGHVPLELCGIVAKKLGTSKNSLNYEEVVKYERYGPPWVVVVEGAIKNDSIISRILKEKHPRTANEILALGINSK